MTKTRVKQSRSREFTNCVVHREELNELNASLTRGEHGPKIESDGFAFGSVDDLCEHLGSEGALTLKMESARPTVTVETSEYSGKVSVTVFPSSQTPEGIACFHSVVSVLEQAALKPAWYSGYRAAIGSSVLFFGALFLFSHTTDWYQKAGSIVIGAASATLYVVSFLSTRKRTRFYGVLRRERPSFWRRKRDDLIVNALTGTMGFALGVVSTLMFQSHK